MAIDGADDPTKKLLIVGGGLAVVVLNTLLSCNMATKPADARDVQQEQLMVEDGQSRAVFWGNPEVSWYDRMFCSGNTRATRKVFGWSICDEQRFLHPFKRELDEQGIAAPSIADLPANKRIIGYYQDPNGTERAVK